MDDERREPEIAPEAQPAPEAAPVPPVDAAPAGPSPETPAAEPAEPSLPVAAGPPPDAGEAAADGAPDDAPSWEERVGSATDRARSAWKTGRAMAERTLREHRLRREINHTKAEKELTLKRLGEEAAQFLLDRGLSHPEIAAAVASIEGLRAKIARKEAEEREVESTEITGRLFDKFKKSIVKLAGYTKIRLEVSMFRNELESQTASLGQFIYSRKEIFGPVFEPSRFVPDLVRKVERLEREVGEMERALADIT